MKLYATTTSERASKGQGGNEYINGVFTCDEDIVIQVRICSYDDENWRLQITTPEGTSFQTYPKQTKGKKQKGEEWTPKTKKATREEMLRCHL